MRKPFSVALVLGTLAACQPQAPSLDIFAPVPELGHGLMQGYLHGEPPLDSAAFVPPPPSEGSARQEADDAASEALRRLEGSARWDQATMDADLHFPAATSIFACALGTTISEAQTPALYRLLKRSLTDLGLATYPAKKRTSGRALSSLTEEQYARQKSENFWKPMAPIRAAIAPSAGVGHSSCRSWHPRERRRFCREVVTTRAAAWCVTCTG